MANNTQNSNFLNSPAWQKFQEAYGNPTTICGTNLFIQKKAALFPYFLASRITFDNAKEVDSAISTILTKVKPTFIRVEPDNSQSFDEISTYCKSQKIKMTKQKAVQPRQSLIIDLEKPSEQILAEMKQKHRYNLRLAQKKGLEFEVFSKDLNQHFERFWFLHSQTANRQEFNTHPKRYYEVMLGKLEKAEMVHLCFVKNPSGEDLATMLLITYNGVATYLHGGSSEKHKEDMAPYLLHWEVILFAQKLGLKQYDLWGTNAHPIDETSIENLNVKNWTYFKDHPSSGTTRFKLGFGGTIINYPGTFDLIINPFGYTAYQMIKKLRHRKSAFN